MIPNYRNQAGRWPFYPSILRDRDPWMPPTFYRHLMPARSIVHLADLHGIPRGLPEFGSFTILTYNILWGPLMQPNGCPEWAQIWEYRRVNLLDEIVAYSADIICLQEVQDNHFGNFFEPVLAELGYTGIYKARTDELHTAEGPVTHGCAIFFRNTVFREVIHHEVEYHRNAFELIQSLEVTERQEAQRHLVKNNVALAVILEMLRNDGGHHLCVSRLCVVNTHIYAGRDNEMHRDDVKLLQVLCLINEVRRITSPGMPIVFCMDMNSTPQSAPYDMLTRGEVNRESLGQLVRFPNLEFSHPWNLASAYTLLREAINDERQCREMMIDPETGEPLFTCGGRRTLDYIIFTVDSLEVESLLGLLDYESVAPTLPSPAWSSDHIALMASFRIKRPCIR